MTSYTELQLADGTAVRFVLTPGTPGTVGPPGGEPAGGYDDPDGMGPTVPVARGEGSATFAVGALRRALHPLGTVLQEVHDAVMASPEPPQEINVTFGVQIGQDLKLGIVGGSGQAHIEVSATWQPRPRTD
ncbi:CU044_2847 family protein [Streptomyces sp. NPDC005805]|uniref:CU044_2847 family protein n=1 Tax=Streptomyces sp. NPDC005805 TaxID=3157068 RepID=UPI0033DAE48D